MLVSPSSPLRVVRTVAQIWRQEWQARNVRETRTKVVSVRQVRWLHRRSAAHRQETRRGEEAYEGADNKLTRAEGIRRAAQKLVKLGIRPNKTLPQPLLDEALEAEESFESAAGSDAESGFPH